VKDSLLAVSVSSPGASDRQHPLHCRLSRLLVEGLKQTDYASVINIDDGMSADVHPFGGTVRFFTFTQRYR